MQNILTDYNLADPKVRTAIDSVARERFGITESLFSDEHDYADPKTSSAYKEAIEEYFNYLDSEPADTEEPGAIATVGRGLAHGALGMGESLGIGMEYLGNRTDSDWLKEKGQEVSTYFGDKAEEYGPPASIAGKNLWDNPEMLADATYWLYNISDSGVSFAASMVPGLAAYKGVKLLSAIPKLAKIANPKVAKIAGAIAGGGAGGALEGTQTYKAVLEKGGTEEEAARSMELMTVGSGILNAMSVDKVLGAAGDTFKQKVIKHIGAGAWEGFTEGLEEPTEVFSKYFGSYLAGEELPTDLEEQLIESVKEAITVFPIAAVTGAGGSVAFGSGETKNEGDASPPDDGTTNKADFSQVSEKLSSATDEELDEIIQKAGASAEEFKDDPDFAKYMDLLKAEKDRRAGVEPADRGALWNESESAGEFLTDYERRNPIASQREIPSVQPEMPPNFKPRDYRDPRPSQPTIPNNQPLTAEEEARKRAIRNVTPEQPEPYDNSDIISEGMAMSEFLSDEDKAKLESVKEAAPKTVPLEVNESETVNPPVVEKKKPIPIEQVKENPEKKFNKGDTVSLKTKSGEINGKLESKKGKTWTILKNDGKRTVHPESRLKLVSPAPVTKADAEVAEKQVVEKDRTEQGPITDQKGTAKSQNPKISPDQKKFIDNKVSKLGSIEAVDRHYAQKSPVADYAKLRAREVFGPVKSEGIGDGRTESDSYDDFKKNLDKTLYETTGKIASAHTTNAVHYEQMFKKLPIDEAVSLLDQVEKHEEFHPDRIKQLRSVLSKRQETTPTPKPPASSEKAGVGESGKEPWEMTRGEFIPDSEIISKNNKTDEPTPNRYKTGDMLIDDGVDDPYVYKFEYINPNDVTVSLEGKSASSIKKMPSTAQYTKWSKEGIEPPPVTIVRTDNGELRSTNRRRIIAAIEAGVDRVPAFVEVGKHKDIIKQALSQNKPVPESVLKDYPELAPTTEKPGGGEVKPKSRKDMTPEERREWSKQLHKENEKIRKEAGKQNNPSLYKKSTWKGKERVSGVIIHKSTKHPGQWQATTWDEDGFSGDTHHNTKEEAINDAISGGNKLIGREEFDRVSNTDRFHTGNENTRQVQEWNKEQHKKFLEKQNKRTGIKGKEDTAYLNDNTPIDYTYEVLELDDLVTSHDDNMDINEAYPAELQPRERGRKASIMQVESMAHKLNPARLGQSSGVANGAPMISPDSNVVESGNGRTLAIRKAYSQETGKAYKKWLTDNSADFGINDFDIEGMDKPVLVRRRTSQVEDRAIFTQKANEAETAKFSSSEQAIIDAGNLTSDDMSTFRPDSEGNIAAASNKTFIGRFLNKMTPEEQSGYLTEDGRASKQLVDRIQAAIFQKAYGSNELLKLVAEESDPDIKNILNGLTASATSFAKARGLDEKLANVTIVDDLVSAIGLIRQAQSENPDIKSSAGKSKLLNQLNQTLSQLDIFGEQHSENTKNIALIVATNIRSGKRIGEFIDNMGVRLRTYIADLSQAEMFGTKEELTSQDLIDRSKDFLEGKYEEKQQDLFGFQQDEEGTSGNRKSNNRRLVQGSEQKEDTGRTPPQKAGKSEVGSPDLLIDFSPEDIDYERARRAHLGTSHVPETRARQRQQDYYDHLKYVHDYLLGKIKPEQREQLAEELERYKEGYLKKYNAVLDADSRTMSSMIAGPANFPVRSNQKKLDAARARSEELSEFEQKAMKGMKRRLGLSNAGISSDDPNAIDKLKEKLAGLEKSHQLMKDANKVIRDKKLTGDEKIPALMSTGMTEEQAKKLLEPDYMGRQGFAPFSLSNSNANIKNVKKRIADLESKSQDETTEKEINGATIVDNVEDNRVQILFEVKPDAETRTKLKKRGFRWSPKNSAWQRKRSRGAMYDAESVLKGEPQFSTTQDLTTPKKSATEKSVTSSKGKADIPAGKSSEAVGGNPFSDSVVRDIVYHSTPSTFDVFDTDINGGAHFGTEQAADTANRFAKEINYEIEEFEGRYYVVPDNGDFEGEDIGDFDSIKEAESFVKQQPKRTPLLAVYLNLKNPKEVEDAGVPGGWEYERRIAEKEGYDGLKYRNEVEDRGSWSYVAFYPEQIQIANPNPSSAPKKGAQYSSSLPGQGVTLKQLQSLFPNQTTGISPDGSVWVRLKNGQGLTIKSVTDLNGEYEYAMQIGRLNKGGIILGKYQNKTITLNRDYASLFTARHELEHFLEDIGLITQGDQVVLDGKIRAWDKQGKLDFNLNKDKRENRANFLAQYLAEREAYRGTQLGKVLQKIADFLDGLIHIGRSSVRKVARGVETGKVYSKEGKETSGKAQAMRNTDTAAFKKWFGDSKVVNEDGEPLVVYHGTQRDFNEFRNDAGHKIDHGWFGEGFYFTEDVLEATSFANSRGDVFGEENGTPIGANLYPVYLSIKNPYQWPKGRKIAKTLVEAKQITADLKKRGYDGVYRSVESGFFGGFKFKEIVAFNPTQIKSIYNRGTWDGSNADILYSSTADQKTDSFTVEDNSTLVDSFKYNVVDMLSPISKVYKAIGKKIPEHADFLLKEQLRTSKAKAGIDRADRKYFTPIRKIIGASNLTVAKVDEFLYARHAPEANARLRLTNAKYYLKKLAEAQVGDKLRNKIAELDSIFDLMEFPTQEIQEAYKKLLDSEVKKADGHLAEAKKNLAEFKKTLGENPTDKESMKLSRLERKVKKGETEVRAKKDWEEFSEKPSGMTDKEAAEISKKYEGNKALEKIAKLFDAMNNEGLEISYKAGRMSKEEYEAVKGTFDYYAPLYREGYEKGRAFAGIGSGIKNLGTDVQTRGGSTKRAVHILANAIVNYETKVVKAKKAEVTKAFIEFVKLHPNKDFWNFEETKTVATYDSSGNIERRPALHIKKGEPKIPVKVDGKTYIISANPGNTHAMRILDIVGGEQKNSGPIVGALSKLNRGLATVNTTWNPEFVISNLIRDLQTAGVNLSDTEVAKMRGRIFKSLPKAMKGLHNHLRGDGSHKWAKIAKQYEKSGAKIGWIDYGKDIETKAKKLESQIDLFRSGHITKKSLTKLLKFVEDYNSIVENAVRLATFEACIKSGMSESKAAITAKGLTVNFNQKGAYGPVINSLYLFANAGIQGSTRIVKALKNSKQARKIVAGSVVAASALAMANSSIGGDDDDGVPYYDKVDDYIKARNMIFMIPGSNGDYIKIPLPWGYNVFWAVGTEIGDAFVKDDYEPLEGVSRLLSTALDAFNPLQSATILQTLSPTIGDPFVQVGENKTFFGAPLMPEGNPFDRTPTPDSERYWSSVRPFSRMIAEKANSWTGGDKIKPGLADISPETLDLIFDTFTGGMGRFILDTANAPLRELTGDLTLPKTPFARKVYGTKSEYKTSSDYRKNITHIFRLHEQIKAYPEKAESIRKDKTYRLFAKARATESRIKKLNKMLKLIKDEDRKAAFEDNIEKLKQGLNLAVIRAKSSE